MTPVDILYIGIFGTMLFSTVLWVLVYLFNSDRVESDPGVIEWPSVSFLVPAYNEEEHVSECIESLLSQEYEGELNVIAINDGSEDETLGEMRKFEDDIEIIDKQNTGKASSMNAALERVETELVGCLDADSVAEKDMVRNMAGYFREENVKGVTPAMKVKNTDTWPQKVMWAEYIYNIFLRKLFSIFDSQWVMPGPGSIYETEYLKEIGGWDEETLTEDMEVAFRMFKNGARLKNSSNAYVDTESPETLRGLLKQRTRWYRGYINNLIRYREILFRPRYGNLGVVLAPFNVVWNSIAIFMALHIVFRLMATVYDAATTYMLVGFMRPSFSFGLQNISLFHLFYAVLAAMGLSILYASIRTSDEGIKLWERKTHYGLYMGIYMVLYGFFWISAVVQEIRGVRHW